MANAGTLWPSPEGGHKPRMWEVSSLYLEEGRILISQTEGLQEESERTGLTKFPSVYNLAQHWL